MDNKLNFKGKGLFVFSDPGGAKAVLTQASALKNSLREIMIISDRDYPFFKDFALTIINPVETADEVIRKFEPDFVFCGTSYTSKIELEYILAAEKNNVLSYAFIDHWTNFRNRFLYKDSYLFPDIILVIDERAKQLAAADNIAPEIIEVFGNPYYSWLKNWQPALSKNQLLALLNISRPKGKLVVFAPDPLSNVNGKEIYGFDEISATEKINTILESNNFDFDFVIKAHPNQNLKALKAVTGNKIIIAETEADINSLIFYADIIIGFFSNFLIEAAILNKKILRFHLSKVTNDPIAALNIGKIVNTTNLIKEFRNTNGA
jgi:hypothetical protein